MPYFTSGGHFSDLLRCSKVQQLKVAIVTLGSDQQGDSLGYACSKVHIIFERGELQGFELVEAIDELVQ
jgi:hypothetical protein